MEINIQEIMRRYANELATMTQRAILAEAQCAALLAEKKKETDDES